MQIEQVRVGAFEVNCLVLWDDPGQAVVIDPGAEADAIETVLSDRGLTVEAYWLTHGHIDHISALPDLLERHPAQVLMHPSDAAWAFTDVNRFPPYLRVPARPDRLEPAEDGQTSTVGPLAARILHTPGHTPGGVCYWFEKEGVLVTGDTLFQDSVGRTDLPGGDWDTLCRSLSRLLALDDAVTLLPGHGPASALGTERRSNPFLRNLAKEPS